MQYKIKILPIAYMDLQRAKKWYGEESDKLTKEFKAEVNKEIEYIGKHPQNYQLKYNELRQSIVAHFPYLIYYIIVDELKQVIVVGILHSSRNPEIIKNRIL